LVKKDEISSTERLLSVIRDRDQTHSQIPPVNTVENRTGQAPGILKRIAGKSTQTIGVDIKNGRLLLASFGAISGKKPTLNQIKVIPLAPEVSEERSRLVQFLNTELTQFCASADCQIWAVLPPEKVNIRSIRIPKVPKNQVPNAVRWTYQKEKPFDQAQTLLDFEVLGDTLAAGVSKTDVMVCVALRQDVDDLSRLFADSGFPLTGISARSFCVQNYFRTGWLKADDELTCCLSIGSSWSTIDVLRPNGDLIVSRGIKAGMTSVIESIKNELANSESTISMPDADDEPVLELPAFDKSEAAKILDILRQDPSVDASNADQIITADDVFEMVLPALERLIRQVERTFEHTTLHFPENTIDKLVISGPVSAYPRLVAHISNQLDLPSELMAPLPATTDAMVRPNSIDERFDYATVVGLALSDNARTPNFLFTHEAERLRTRKKTVNLLALACFLVGVIILCAFHFEKQHRIQDKLEQLEQLRASLDTHGEKAGQAGILQLATELKQRHRVLRNYSRNYLPVALIGEVTNLASEHIRFIRLAGQEATQDLKIPKDGRATAGLATLTIDGIVSGNANNYEARLADFLMALKQSPLLGHVTLSKKMVQQLPSEKVMRFTLSVKVI